MKFSDQYPGFFSQFLQVIEKLQQPYLRMSRLAHYVGGGYVLAFSYFGHKYRLRADDLQALTPLFKPSPSDAAQSALMMLLNHVGSDHVYIEPSSVYHPLNHARFQNTGSISIFHHDFLQLQETLENAYLNDLQEYIHLYQSVPLGVGPIHKIAPAHIFQKEVTLPFERAAPVIDFEKLKLQLLEEGSSDLFFSTQQLMNMRSVTIDGARYLPINESFFCFLRENNKRCYFMIRIGHQHVELWPQFMQVWKDQGYEFWRLPDLQAYTGPGESTCRWVLMVHEQGIKLRGI